MVYLFLCIVFNSLLYVIFTIFKKHHINTLQAIVVNYLVAFVLAYTQSATSYDLLEIPFQKWFFSTVILAVLFISLFNLMAKTTQYLGVSVAAISGKMSMIIPVVFGIIIYKEPISGLKIFAIVLALVAVYLTSVKGKGVVNTKLLYLPMILFLGSGILDTLLKYVEKNYVLSDEVSVFIGTIFLNAMLIGVVVLLINKKLKEGYFEAKNILAGFVLGVFNYYAMYFLVKSLQTIGKLDSSRVFTLNNIGIVLLSALLGFILFQEKFSTKNKIGILFAIISVYLLMISS